MHFFKWKKQTILATLVGIVGVQTFAFSKLKLWSKICVGTSEHIRPKVGGEKKNYATCLKIGSKNLMSRDEMQSILFTYNGYAGKRLYLLFLIFISTYYVDHIWFIFNASRDLNLCPSDCLVARSHLVHIRKKFAIYSIMVSLSLEK